MKNMHIFYLSLSFLSSITFGMTTDYTPKNTIMAFDIDEVMIRHSLLLNIMEPLKYVLGWNKNRELSDKKGKSITGTTFHLLYFGMNKKFFAKHIPQILENVSKSRKFIDGTEKICRYLKKKGYTIVFATNKDRVEYDIVAQALGKKFSSLPELTFVAHGANTEEFIKQIKSFANLWDTPQSYKELAEKALTIKPTEKILHVPGKKPDHDYFQYMENNIEEKFGSDKNIIFIDDRPANVEGFNTLERQHKALRHGIIFKDPQQLAQELIELGTLSEIDDKDLLDEIRYTSFFGKLRIRKRNAMKKMNAIVDVIKS